MTEILKIIVEYVAIWAPSLVAILGIVSTVLVALSKTKEAFVKLNKDETLKELKTEMKRLISENEELVRCNKLLLDNYTKIKDYADTKKKEG
jgi:cell division protein FtsB